MDITTHVIWNRRRQPVCPEMQMVHPLLDQEATTDQWRVLNNASIILAFAAGNAKSLSSAGFTQRTC